jgi:hypothetical protein
MRVKEIDELFIKLRKERRNLWSCINLFSFIFQCLVFFRDYERTQAKAANPQKDEKNKLKTLI